MALGDPYITNAQLKTHLGISAADTNDDTLLDSVRVAATEWVRDYTQRDFNKTTTATARQFRSSSPYRCAVYDFHTITDLVVKTDDGGTGTYSQTWSATDYVLEPFDNVIGSISGVPFQTVRAVAGRTFPTGTARPNVQVTAQWGWNAVPEAVTLATKIVAAYLFNLKDSPLGIASFGDAGIIRTRQGMEAAMLLREYCRPGRTGAFLA
jgi:hypothetical protein